jgi:hypothetical protein
LVSFPKSGNTWTRFLLGNLMNPGNPINFAEIERVVPDIAACPRADFRRVPRPRLIKSHDGFDPRYRRVIYIIRDPRDVAVSLYFYAKKVKNIDDSFSLEAFIKRLFVPGRNYAGTWGENAGSWLINASNVAAFCLPRIGAHSAALGPAVLADAKAPAPGATGHGRKFLLVRYEDLLDDAHAGLWRIADFLGLQASSERIEQAVARSSADSMRKLESAQSLQWQTTRETRKDIPFVRQAKSGQWRTALSANSVAEIESAWGHLMRLAGYELASIT